MGVCFALLIFTCIILSVSACEPEQSHNGCMISGNTCKCGYGCKTEYIFKTRRACRNALRAGTERTVPVNYGSVWDRMGTPQQSATPPLPPLPPRTSNICSSMICLRGICIQTATEPGFTCKCEGTGFYGQRCEKACPTAPIAGMVFPHECVVI